MIKILFFCLVVLAGGLSAQASDGFNENFLLGRALEKSGFSTDQKFESYEIKKLNLYERLKWGTAFESGQITVDLFAGGYLPGGVRVKLFAPEYEIEEGNRKINLFSFKKRVGDIVAEAGLILAKEDRVDPPLSSEAKNKKIIITRVEEAEVEEFESLPYQKKEILDPNLLRGRTEISEMGQKGKKRLLYLVRRENGSEVSKVLIKSEIIDQPVDQITKIGTKVMVLSSISGEASWTKGVTAMRKYSRGTLIRITNLENGKKVETRVGGWGPQPYTGRILDLSQDEFAQIANLGQGTTNVLVEEISE